MIIVLPDHYEYAFKAFDIFDFYKSIFFNALHAFSFIFQLRIVQSVA